MEAILMLDGDQVQGRARSHGTVVVPWLFTSKQTHGQLKYELTVATTL